MRVVIVESPAKAKTINKYLGPSYSVIASIGHVRDLSAKEGAVRPENDFEMEWSINTKNNKRIAEIVNIVKNADMLILATDPDREGEAIAWHIIEILKAKKALKSQRIERVVFNAITKQAIMEAMNHPRCINSDLVEAYLARRALDYLVGFSLSPVLWHKLPGAKSAGRVQSATLRLICDREQNIESFVPQEYWSILVDFTTPENASFEAHVTSFLGKKISRLDIKTEEEAIRIRNMLKEATFTVSNISSKPQLRNPQPPFTTSTLQQAASTDLGLSVSRTMQLAQALYEGSGIRSTQNIGGLITYMRTDSVAITHRAITEIRDIINNDYGHKFLPSKPRHYETKTKNAQEAHEAIRPTDIKKRPSDLREVLQPDQLKLYELIWKRSVASQMMSATLERTVIDIEAKSTNEYCVLHATGFIITFEGFLTLYPHQQQDDTHDKNEKKLPAMAIGDILSREDIKIKQSFTEPPARYKEATLIKKMEEIGIGRPSTFASTIQLLQDRAYVRLDKRRLIPESRGRIVTAFLEGFFQRYVEYDFTAQLENDLDKIASGELQWKSMLGNFWNDFLSTIEKTKSMQVSDSISYIDDKLNAHLYPKSDSTEDPRICPFCGKRLSMKLGRFGAFIGCSGYPECRYTRQIGAMSIEATNKNMVLGKHETSGSDVTLKDGRFGLYVQLEDENNIKRAHIPKDWNAATITLEKALALLALPRSLGIHPESGKVITAGLGRFGPFVKHNTNYASLKATDEVFTVDVDSAITLLSKKENSANKGTSVLKELGEHPIVGGLITIRVGRYGPYVSHGKVNLSIPVTVDPEALSMDEVIVMLSKKAAKPKTKGTSTKGKKTKYTKK